MPAIRTTRRLLTAYAEREPGQRDHDEARSTFDLEERLAWGIHLFRGLTDLEARTQAHALRMPGVEVEQILEVLPVFYQLWVEVSESYFERAKEYVERGNPVEGFEEFRDTLEEARCLVGNLGLEDEIRPIEELMALARPNNPRPERYGD